MTQKTTAGLKLSGDKPSTKPSLMLEEYLGTDGIVIDRLLKGVDQQKVITRYGKVREEVNSLVAIISGIPDASHGKL